MAKQQDTNRQGGRNRKINVILPSNRTFGSLLSAVAGWIFFSMICCEYGTNANTKMVMDWYPRQLYAGRCMDGANEKTIIE